MATLAVTRLCSAPRQGGFAVRDVDLVVPPGAICVLVGPSGSGKTTLLRLVAGLEPTASGRVHIGGVDVTDWPPGSRDLAWSPQEHPLYPHLDVERNIGFALRLKRRLRPDADERVRAEARATGVERLLHRMPNTLSAGERQAAGLARATARMPTAYLLDEPLAGIDHQQRTRLRSELGRFLRALEAPAIVATNDQLEALALGDVLVVLRDGAVVQTGPPAELMDRPDSVFVATFLGTPAMNILPGVLEAGAQATWVRFAEGAAPLQGMGGSLREELDGRDVLLGVRAEHLHVADTDTTLSARTDRVEPLGHETLVHASLADATRVVVRSPPDRPVPAGGTLTLVVDTARSHLFDPATELALWHAVDEP